MKQISIKKLLLTIIFPVTIVVLIVGLIITNYFLFRYKEQYENTLKNSTISILTFDQDQKLFWSKKYDLNDSEKSIRDITKSDAIHFEVTTYPFGTFISAITNDSGTTLKGNANYFWLLKFYNDESGCPSSKDFECQIGINEIGLQKGANLMELYYTKVISNFNYSTFYQQLFVVS